MGATRKEIVEHQLASKFIVINGKQYNVSGAILTIAQTMVRVGMDQWSQDLWQKSLESLDNVIIATSKEAATEIVGSFKPLGMGIGSSISAKSIVVDGYETPYNLLAMYAEILSNEENDLSAIIKLHN